MGEDKAVLDWAGQRAVERVAAVARAAGAEALFTVGARDLGLPRAVEETPGGGPVAGIVAGCQALARAGLRRVLVLAVDAPTLHAEDLGPLLNAPAPGAAYAHLHLPLVMAIDALPPEAGPGWSMARLLTEARLPLLEARAEALPRLRGANTPEERAALLRDLTGRPPAGF
jgi:molybdopterin-guanine dinucleotide biosynthesis protein A